MLSGTLVLNGIDDPDLDIIVRIKEQHEQSLHFNPQQMQTSGPMPPQYGRPGFPGPQPGAPPPPTGQVYNNVNLGWTEADGLAAAIEILHRLAPDAPSGPFPPLPPR